MDVLQRGDGQTSVVSVFLHNKHITSSASSQDIHSTNPASNTIATAPQYHEHEARCTPRLHNSRLSLGRVPPRPLAKITGSSTPWVPTATRSKRERPSRPRGPAPDRQKRQPGRRNHHHRRLQRAGGCRAEGVPAPLPYYHIPRKCRCRVMFTTFPDLPSYFNNTVLSEYLLCKTRTLATMTPESQ